MQLEQGGSSFEGLSVSTVRGYHSERTSKICKTRIITHAWLLWAPIGAARRREGRENKGNGERVGGWSCREARPLITG